MEFQTFTKDSSEHSFFHSRNIKIEYSEEDKTSKIKQEERRLGNMLMKKLNQRKDLVEQGIKIFIQYYFTTDWIYDYTMEALFFTIVKNSSNIDIYNRTKKLGAFVKAAIDLYPTAKIMYGITLALDYNLNIPLKLIEDINYVNCMMNKAHSSDLWRKAALVHNPLSATNSVPKVLYISACLEEARNKNDIDAIRYWEVIQKKQNSWQNVAFEHISGEVERWKVEEQMAYDRNWVSYCFNQAEKWRLSSKTLSGLWEQLAENIIFCIQRKSFIFHLKSFEKSLTAEHISTVWSWCSSLSKGIAADMIHVSQIDVAESAIKIQSQIDGIVKKRSFYHRLHQESSSEIALPALCYYDDLIEQIKVISSLVNSIQSLQELKTRIRLILTANEKFDSKFQKVNNKFQSGIDRFREVSSRLTEDKGERKLDSVLNSSSFEQFLVNYRKIAINYVHYIQLRRRKFWLLEHERTKSNIRIQRKEARIDRSGRTLLRFLSHSSQVESSCDDFSSEEIADVDCAVNESKSSQEVWRESNIFLAEITFYHQKLAELQIAFRSLPENRSTLGECYSTAIKKIGEYILTCIASFPKNVMTKLEDDPLFSFAQSAIVFSQPEYHNDFSEYFFKLCNLFIQDLQYTFWSLDAARVLRLVSNLIEKVSSTASETITSFFKYLMVLFEELKKWNVAKELAVEGLALHQCYRQSLNCVSDHLIACLKEDEQSISFSIDNVSAVVSVFLRAFKRHEQDDSQTAELEIMKILLISVIKEDFDQYTRAIVNMIIDIPLYKLKEDQKKYWLEIMTYCVSVVTEEASRSDDNPKAKKRWDCIYNSIRALTAWMNEDHDLYQKLRPIASMNALTE